MTDTDNGAVPEVSDRDLANFAKEWLEENQGASVYLSKLGQQISRHFRTPVRELLGVRKLSNVLESQLGNAIEFGGDAFSRTVRLVHASAVTAPLADPKFDSQFWAGFSKPIPEGRARFIKTTFPFRFDDFSVGAVYPTDRIEILSSDIPDTALGRPERNAAVKEMIDHWCNRHSLNSTSFLMPSIQRSEKQARSFRDPVSSENKESSKGVSALIALIEAVPAAERPNFSLPLNLIARLLQ